MDLIIKIEGLSVNLIDIDYDMKHDECEHYKRENTKLKEDKKILEDKIPKATSNQIFLLEQEVSRLRGELYKIKLSPQEDSNPYPHPHPKYLFSEVPNDCVGQKFTDDLKKYLNRKRYTVRLRGQHLDKSKLSKNETWRTYSYGYPINKSSHLRVYIEEKKIDEELK